MDIKAINKGSDLSTWEKQYREAMQEGHKSENDLFDEVSNDFDKNEWILMSWKNKAEFT